jgi:nicotinate-nucleotide pyrophosphorylase (carboxylating)
VLDTRISVSPPPIAEIRRIVRAALAEDMPWGDLTTEALVPQDVAAVGYFIAREAGVVCGLSVAEQTFRELHDAIRFTSRARDGDRAEPGSVLAEVAGPAGPILTGERTALNLMQRMSGIATAAARYVEAVAGTGARIVDTRKTAPGLRALDKYAVRCGGGSNHRHSLSDGVLVKDNHLAALGTASLSEALLRARSSVPHMVRVEVEVDRLDQIEEALAGEADIILLDNMDPATLRQAVGAIAGRALTEASGGVTLETVRAIAEAGVDLISVGALTHSVRAVDIALDLDLLG